MLQMMTIQTLEFLIMTVTICGTQTANFNPTLWGNAQAPYMFIRFYQDSLYITSTVTIDTLITDIDTTYTEVVTYDTAFVEIIHAKNRRCLQIGYLSPFFRV